MSSEAAAGFWSYAHEDDKLDGGGILKLAYLIKEEYNLLSGQPLDLFVDHDSIAWGEEWRARIDSALVQTTFFIPVITPRYFTRPECRRELLEFAAKAKSLGVAELLMPILYVQTPELSKESSDKAVVLVAKTQYQDWRTNRLLEVSSREHKTAVNVLSQRLLDIARKVAENQFTREIAEDLSSDGVDGITEVADKIMTLLPEWLEAVMTDKIRREQVFAIETYSDKQITRLRAASAPASAILASQIREAREMLPLADAAQKDAKIYLARSIELDPSMSLLFRLLAEHSENFSLILPIKEAIDEAITEVRLDDAYNLDPTFRAIETRFAKRRHLARVFQRCEALFREKSRILAEANNIVRRWNDELSSVPMQPGSAVSKTSDSHGSEA